MKKIVMVLIAVLATVIIAGCSKASKFEGLMREAAALAQKQGEKVSEEDIKKEVEKFKALSSDEQDKKIKEAEAGLGLLKAAAEMEKKLK